MARIYGLYFFEVAGAFVACLGIVAILYLLTKGRIGTTAWFLIAAALTAWFQIDAAASTADAIARIMLLLLPQVGILFAMRIVYRRQHKLFGISPFRRKSE